MLTVRRGPAAVRVGCGVTLEGIADLYYGLLFLDLLQIIDFVGEISDIQAVAPRALQNHGDCISWRQTEDGVLESEEKQQMEGRKVCDGCM